nr:PE family protein [Mycobacterium riyadhense]
MSSFVVVSPQVVLAAAADLSVLGSTISAASAAAASATTAVASAAQDEVSAAIAGLFSEHGRDYQVLAGRVAGFHEQFSAVLAASAGGVCGRGGFRGAGPAGCGERAECGGDGAGVGRQRR